MAGVWSYSYAPDSALSAGWSAAPSVSTAPAPSLISGNISLPGSDEEQFGVNPGDTLQTFLERLSLSSHLGLFQVKTIYFCLSLNKFIEVRRAYATFKSAFFQLMQVKKFLTRAFEVPRFYPGEIPLSSFVVIV